MKEYEVSAAEQWDAKPKVRAMRKRDELWRIAEGRMSWAEAIGFFLPLLLIAMGLIQLAREGQLPELVSKAGGAGFAILVSGAVLFGTFIWNHTQRQLRALRELLRRLEQERH